MYFYKANINLITSFLLIQEFPPLMINSIHGHIVTVVSTARFETGVSDANYACSRISVLALYEGLAQELSH